MIQQLSDVPRHELRQEFIDALDALKLRVLKRVKPKYVNDQAINGPMLLELAESYCDALN